MLDRRAHIVPRHVPDCGDLHVLSRKSGTAADGRENVQIRIERTSGARRNPSVPRLPNHYRFCTCFAKDALDYVRIGCAPNRRNSPTVNGYLMVASSLFS
jgi:hypothetical protein